MAKRVIFVMFVVSALSSVTFAVPQLINYQGKLSSKTGTPVTGTVSMVFSMYTVTTGGVPVWTETQSVSVSSGIYNVLLGSVMSLPASVFDTSALYLGVQVGTDAEMSPRQQLSSVPYAIKAASVESVPASAITNTQIAAGAQIDYSKLNHPDTDHTTLTPYGHTHSGDIITSGTVSTARLNVGTTAGTIAAGNHNHEAIYRSKYTEEYSASFNGVYCNYNRSSAIFDGLLWMATSFGDATVCQSNWSSGSTPFPGMNKTGAYMSARIWWETVSIDNNHSLYILAGGSENDTVAPTNSIGFLQQSNALKGCLFDSSRWTVDLGVTVANDEVHNLLAIVRDATTVDYYVDGVLRGTISGHNVFNKASMYYKVAMLTAGSVNPLSVVVSSIKIGTP